MQRKLAALCALLLSGSLTACLHGNSAPAGQVLEGNEKALATLGQKAPTFDLKTADGQRIASETLSDQYTLLEFVRSGDW